MYFFTQLASRANRGLGVAQTMDKNSKVLFTLFFVLLGLSVGTSFYRYIIAKDYIVEARAECNPTQQACFVSEEDQSYYALIRKKAADIPLCNPGEEGCDALACESGQSECEVIYCSEALAESRGVGCSDPAKVNAEGERNAEPVPGESTGDASTPEEPVSDEGQSLDDFAGEQ